jgi:hypothetical protein
MMAAIHAHVATRRRRDRLMQIHGGVSLPAH